MAGGGNEGLTGKKKPTTTTANGLYSVNWVR